MITVTLLCFNWQLLGIHGAAFCRHPTSALSRLHTKRPRVASLQSQSTVSPGMRMHAVSIAMTVVAPEAGD